VKLIAQYYSILIIVAFIGAISWQSFTVIHFYSNQLEIEQDYCINKDEPSLQCHGQCYLASQIENSDFEKSTPVESRIDSRLIVFQAFSTPSAINIQSVDQNKDLFYNDNSTLEIGYYCIPSQPPQLG